MSLIEWNNTLSVGITQIDSEHRKLVAILNNLFDAMSKGEAKEKLGEVLFDLISYTKQHFANEEALMSRYGYPDSPAHRRQHDNLTQEVVAFYEKFKSGNAMISVSIMNFLKKWLTEHILVTDKNFGAFLHSKGVK